MSDQVNHPPHYTGHPSGVECIQVTEHMNFCRGNAMKYLWRAGEKSNELEDLRKARWYIDREIARLEASSRIESWLTWQEVPEGIVFRTDKVPGVTWTRGYKIAVSSGPSGVGHCLNDHGPFVRAEAAA